MMGSFGMPMNGSHAPFGALGVGGGSEGGGGGMRPHAHGTNSNNPNAALQMVAPWMMPPVHHRPTLAGAATSTASGTPADDSSCSNSGSSSTSSSSTHDASYSGFHGAERRRDAIDGSGPSPVLSAMPSAPVVYLNGSHGGGHSNSRSGSSTPPMELHNKNIGSYSSGSTRGSNAYSGTSAGPILSATVSRATAAATPTGSVENSSSIYHHRHPQSEGRQPPAHAAAQPSAQAASTHPSAQQPSAHNLHAHASAQTSTTHHDCNSAPAATPSNEIANSSGGVGNSSNGNGNGDDNAGNISRRNDAHHQQQGGAEMLEVPLRGGQDDTGSQKSYGSGSRNSSVEDFLSLVQSGDIPAPDNNMLCESIFPGSNHTSGSSQNTSSSNSATAPSTPSSLSGAAATAKRTADEASGQSTLPPQKEPKTT